MINMKPIKQIEKGDKILKIYQDNDGESPREWDNLGTMLCFHSRYSLGDETDLSSNQFNSWGEIREYLIKEKKAVVILPLFLYDHSGISMSTSRTGQYACRWDSGQVGFIYATRKDILDNFQTKRLSKEQIERTTNVLVGEVETYNQYLTGDVYGYEVIKRTTCKHCGETKEEIIDSCWGFYGDDFEKNGLYANAGISEVE